MIKAKRNFITPTDEFYTTIEEVEYIFTQIIDTQQLEDKIVYCPCDSEKSAFTIWLNKHKDEYKIKEFIHTSDDFNTHEDIFEKADIVITNPPFSKIVRELLPLIKRTNCKFFLFGTQMRIDEYMKYDCIFIPCRRPHFKFITPIFKDNNNNIYYNFYVDIKDLLYFSNLKVNILKRSKRRNFKNKSYKDINIIGDDKYLTIDKTIEFPYDYGEPVLVPLSFYDNNYIDQFTLSLPENHKRNFYSDGKGRYIRILAQRKPEFVGQKFI